MQAFAHNVRLISGCKVGVTKLGHMKLKHKRHREWIPRQVFRVKVPGHSVRTGFVDLQFQAQHRMLTALKKLLLRFLVVPGNARGIVDP